MAGKVKCNKCGKDLLKCECRPKKEQKFVDKQLKGDFIVKKKSEKAK